MRKKGMPARVAVIIVILIYILAIVRGILYAGDQMICDGLYKQLSGPSGQIKIIAIDEETLKEYGSLTTWSRDKCAELVTLLTEDETCTPAVIGLDIMFMGTTEDETDQALADACRKAGNVVVASNIVYRGRTKVAENGERYMDSNHIDFIEMPYDTLAGVTDAGYANALISRDGVIRSTRVCEEYNGARVGSFDDCILQVFARQGFSAGAYDAQAYTDTPVGFFYSGTVGEYAHFSLKNVLNGSVPVQEFKDCIVLVGAYASGLQDAYVAAVERGRNMNGVEIHANIIQALMEGKLYAPVNVWVYAWITVLVWTVLLWIGRRCKLLPAILMQLAAAGMHIAVGMILAGRGIRIPQIYVLLLFALTIAYLIVDKYLLERLRRRKVIATFKKYVAPQVVDEISKSGMYELKLGGEKKDIAVLFVDIRGFTPLSESLEPEQVVGILNEYLALTTGCIFENNGTLDKFIGDATMAVFNAPFDQEEYEMCAIRTALAIRAGGDALSQRLEKKYGKSVRFGIGVNCGEAVVGNIGCDVRMDYTAIGDTVNTAARLESRAQAGEILISPALYERVKDRIDAEPVGEMALKGKAETMLVYRVNALSEGEENA